MVEILEIDKLQRRLISILFRLLLMGYSIFLLYYYGSLFQWYTNLVIFIIYLMIYFFLFTSNKWLSILRLVNDYSFINYILFQIHTIDIYAFALLFAPILNNHNHSGNKKSNLLYFFTLLSLFILTKKIEICYSFPILLFFIINFFDSLRAKYFKFQQQLNSIIDHFFIADTSINKPHLIYQEVISVINDSKIFPFLTISSIICFKIEKDTNRLTIVNGTKFLWNFDIVEKQLFLGKLKEIKQEKIFYNIKLNVENQTIENNFIIVCSKNTNFYCFVFISENQLNWKNFPYSLFRPLLLLIPIFYRLSLVLEAFLNQRKNEWDSLQTMKEKFNYVNNAVNAMHFIRNRISPIKNYFSMINDNILTMTLEAQKKRKELLIESERKIELSIKEIDNRAHYILTKSNNPFNVSDLNFFELYEFFGEIKKIWNYFFEVENFEINWDVHNNGSLNYKVKYNYDGMELILTNWISNMKKYNRGEYGIKLDETEKYYNIIFYNDFDISVLNTTNFIDDFNRHDKIEINKRQSHGLLELNNFLLQMDIESEMKQQEDKIYFSLNLKKYSDDKNIDN